MTGTNKLPAASRVNPAASLMDPGTFDQMYRVGKMLASSALFPEHLRKGTPEQAAANGALVMNMAMRLQEDPLTIAQEIFFVGGKPSFSTKYMIAKANQHGTFKDQIDWDVEGGGDTLSVTAFATIERTGRKVSMTCDMDMARSEGWVKNPKYKSMPEVMLRYRSAAFLIRMYCPEVMVGVPPMQVEVELEAMRDVTPPEPTPAPASKPSPAKAKASPTQDAEEIAASPDQEEETPDASPDLEMFQDLTNSILADLAEVSAASVGDVLEMYGPQIEQIKAVAPDLHAQIVDAADAKIAE